MNSPEQQRENPEYMASSPEIADEAGRRKINYWKQAAEFSSMLEGSVDVEILAQTADEDRKLIEQFKTYDPGNNKKYDQKETEPEK